MLRVLRPFVLLIILAVWVPVQVQAQDTTEPVLEYIVTGTSANLRSGPGTSFAAVDTLATGDSVFIYTDAEETPGWLRVFREGEDDAYIADFLVERAPMRFYSAEQEPIVIIEGRGKQVTDIYDIPTGAYRLDVTVSDRSFILETVVVDGDCRDDVLFNEFNTETTQLTISGLFVSSGCSLLFESDNVDGAWRVEIRDILDLEFIDETAVQLDDGVTLTGIGRALSMPTVLPEGIWQVTANVQDRSFILYARPLGSCEEETVFNEFVSGVNSLDVSTVYRSPADGCVIFWETSNVDGEWMLTFEKLR